MSDLQKPEMIKIIRTSNEAENIHSIFFDKKIGAKPGQFVMLWIPGLDEKPFTVAYSGEDGFGVTVSCVGRFSRKLCGMKAGDTIGFRGPYGTSFSLGNAKRIALVGGGYGTAALLLLAREALEKNISVAFITGARTRNRIVYESRMKELGLKPIITTDDGSYGIKGNAADALELLLSKEKIGKVFACGPEMMLKRVVEICSKNKTDCEISVERRIKCGVGLCGSCCVDPLGIRMCVEGPVIGLDTALQLTELGSYRRVKSSRKEKF